MKIHEGGMMGNQGSRGCMTMTRGQTRGHEGHQG
jgi:hypothetical protein